MCACAGALGPRIARAAHIAFLSCRTNWKNSKKKKSKSKKEGQDLYLLLGLQNERWMANANQIKNGKEMPLYT
jgi:hypothetical protein